MWAMVEGSSAWVVLHRQVLLGREEVETCLL